MSGKIWGKLRFGYLEQVLTAGVLLTVVSFLLFGVITALNPASTPPILRTAPVPDAIEPLDAAADTQPNASGKMITVQDQATLQQITEVPVKTMAVVEDQDAFATTAAIRELWSGAKLLGFGWQYHSLYKDWRYHNGIDIYGGEGQVVPALLSGEVIEVYTDKQYGLTVAVRSGKYTLYYGSMASVAVPKNTKITQGKPIGSMGISAAELEPHLHLTAKTSDSNQIIDPHEIFPNMP